MFVIHIVAGSVYCIRLMMWNVIFRFLMPMEVLLMMMMMFLISVSGWSAIRVHLFK